MVSVKHQFMDKCSVSWCIVTCNSDFSILFVDFNVNSYVLREEKKLLKPTLLSCNLRRIANAYEHSKKNALIFSSEIVLFCRIETILLRCIASYQWIEGRDGTQMFSIARVINVYSSVCIIIHDKRERAEQSRAQHTL